MRFAVIFDLDGVLVDSPTIIQSILQRVASEHGIILRPEELAESYHIPLHIQVGRWNERRGTSLVYGDVVGKYMDYEKDYLRHHSILVPGVRLLLEDLKNNAVKMGVCTSAEHKRLTYMLSTMKIDSFFDEKICLEDVVHPKPDPEPYLLSAKALNVSPNHCIGIEDTSTGVTSIKRAGMKTIGFAPNSSDAKSLASADLVVSKMSELSYEKLSQLMK